MKGEVGEGEREGVHSCALTPPTPPAPPVSSSWRAAVWLQHTDDHEPRGPEKVLPRCQNLSGSRPPPRYAYDPSVFAFRSLSTVPPRSPLTPQEELV
ncbi:hypothetical protein JZ751_003176 [Albula glossodonta]|uniref:Uncharacterized protein n=1 Tax=Albula glossodonta TaxID=121402 RepID=A0A8T2NGP8_9TELE|nr:hypothetical protein JZ751_003176 [Albula glossodonta]